MEVKIGVLHTPREIVLETALTPEEVESTVSAALKSVDGALSLTDDRGRKVIVPANLVAYVEIAQADARRVGFVAGCFALARQSQFPHSVGMPIGDP